MPKISQNPHAELRQLFYATFYYCLWSLNQKLWSKWSVSKRSFTGTYICTQVHTSVHKSSKNCRNVDRFGLCSLITFLILFCHKSSSHNFSPYIDPIWFLVTFHLPFSFSPENSEIQFMFIHIKSLTWCLGSLTSVFNQEMWGKLEKENQM